MTRRLVIIGLIGAAIGALLAARVLVVSDWNPTATIRFGEAFPEHNVYAEELLGEIIIAPQAGHDGKFFFTQAMDPFYLEPDVHAVYLDRPSYRAQRMLYPTLASLGGVAPPQATAWGLILVNILAMGVGTAFTAGVAVRMGISRWFGLAFALNPGVLVGVNIDGAEVMATAGLMAGVYYVLKGSLPAASIFLTLGSLARETMLLGVVGLAAFWYLRHRRIPWIMTGTFVVVGAWWLYVQTRLEDGLAQDTQALGPPLVGFFRAFQRWLETPGSTVDLLMGMVLIVVSVSVVVRSLRTPTALGWAVTGFAVLGLLLSEPVWFRYFDSTRALAPVLTGYVLLIPALLKEKRGARADQALSSRGSNTE